MSLFALCFDGVDSFRHFENIISTVAAVFKIVGCELPSIPRIIDICQVPKVGAGYTGSKLNGVDIASCVCDCGDDGNAAACDASDC